MARRKRVVLRIEGERQASLLPLLRWMEGALGELGMRSGALGLTRFLEPVPEWQLVRLEKVASENRLWRFRGLVREAVTSVRSRVPPPPWVAASPSSAQPYP